MVFFQIMKYIINNNPIRMIAIRMGQALFYQIYKRLFSPVLIKKLFNGTKLYLFPQSPIASAFVYTAIPDRSEIEALRSSADQNTIFLDVGANIGAYCLLLKDKVKAVYAFEAHPETATLCKQNFELNHIDPNYVKNVAVSLNCEPLYITDFAAGDPTNHLAKNQENGIQVSATTLDLFIEKSGFNADVEFIVKIDVEGFEYDVLLGSQKNLASGRIKAIVFENYSSKQNEILAMLKQLGYHMTAVSQHNTYAVLHKEKYQYA